MIYSFIHSFYFFFFLVIQILLNFKFSHFFFIKYLVYNKVQIIKWLVVFCDLMKYYYHKKMIIVL